MGKRRRKAAAEPAADAAPSASGGGGGAAEDMNEYERARAARIAANNARMEVRTGLRDPGPVLPRRLQ